MTYRVIHVMTHPPAYEMYAGQPRPEFNWDTPAGSWVGIWGYDWADLLAIEVQKINNRIKHEVWQPDLRADRVYSKEIFPGVIHRLFPASEARRFWGFIKNSAVNAPAMLHTVPKGAQHIFHMGQHLAHPINRALFLWHPEACFMASFHGEIRMPIFYIFKIQKNLFKKINYLIEHYQTKRLFKKVDYTTIQSSDKLSDLKKYYRGPTKTLTMGINFTEYKTTAKSIAREELNLPSDKIILLTICLLGERKQVDKLIEVLNLVNNDFLLIVMGSGERDYERFLAKKAEMLLSKNRIAFVGYRSGKEKLKYLSAADLFIHVSKSEAGPVVNMEAMASKLPILTTDTGYTAEFLKKNKAGCVVGINDYEEWKRQIESFLSGQRIKTVDYNLAKQEFDWENVASKASGIYEDIYRAKVKLAR